MFQTFLEAIGTAGATLIIALSGVFIAWLTERFQTGRLDRTLEKSSKILDFAERWSKIRADIHKGNGTTDITNTTLIREMLDIAAEAIRDDFTDERKATRDSGGTQPFVKRIFLVGGHKRTISPVARMVYYMLLLGALLVVILRIIHWNAQAVGGDIIAVCFLLVAAFLVKSIIERS